MTSGEVACLYQLFPFDNFRHWMGFIIQVPLMSFLAFFGILGNNLACAVLAKEKPFTSTSILLIALAVADNLVLISNFLSRTFVNFNYYYGWLVAFREFHERSLSYLNAFIWYAKAFSIYLTVCVAAERHVAVCFPLKAAVICTKRKAYLAVGLVCLLSFIYRIPLIFVFDVISVLDPCSGTERPWFVHSTIYFNDYFQLIYLISLHIIINSLFPLIVLIIFTYRIISTLKQAANKNLTRNVDYVTAQMKSTSLRVVVVVIVFIILEMPGGIYQIVSAFERYQTFKIPFEVIEIVEPISYFLNTCNSFVNFYIYIIIGSSFRRTLIGIVKCERHKPMR
jgi:hypothetical protein